MLTETFEFVKPSREVRELAILTEIGKNSACSQRSLARVARVSATMVNAYVDSLVGRGDVEVTGKTNRSYRYLLTGVGKNRRDDLLFRISREVIRLYGRMKREFGTRLERYRDEGIARVVLFGAAEMAELVALAAEGTGIEVVGIVDSDPARQGRRIGEIEVTDPGTIAGLNPDAVVITSYGHVDEIHDKVRPLEARGIQIIRL